ncbi:MAG: alanine racemase [Ignavibacteria bacterium]|nr:alanine racemase [Ignavibacteria bacterium]
MNITVPTLLVDKDKCYANIKFMSEKAAKNNLIFRPHFKTHQSLEIANWYREFGIDKITVSSLRMAEYFVSDGWSDITVAFPVNVLEIDRINFLAEKVTLNLLITSHEVVTILNEKLKSKVNFFIKIDTGTHRTGIDAKNKNEISEILSESKKSDKLIFKGFLAHSGHTYKANSAEDIRKIHNEELRILNELKADYIKDYPGIINSVGDTPACSLLDNFEGMDEIRPGNFAFYDLQQWKIGSCALDKIAVAMACPVVSKNNERKEILIYGGGIHFSKEVSALEDGTPYFGYVVKLNEKGWDLPDKKSYIRALSQEHGLIKASYDFYNEIKIGDVVGVLPIHSCMTADCMKKIYTLEGEEINMMTY